MSIRSRLDAMKVRPGYWFARKLYGYGATPVTWQGWLSVFAYIALVALLAWRMPTDFLRFGTIIPLTVAYLYLVWTKTDGGFAWRWGPDRK